MIVTCTKITLTERIRESEGEREGERERGRERERERERQGKKLPWVYYLKHLSSN